MQNFSFVFQNVYLFHDTIANNIRFGQPDAPMEKVVAAAKKARCHDFILKLPQGYETVIGEAGGTLSGGERQRLSIARAMMKDAPIIILDEATANVDPENEKELMEAIQEADPGENRHHDRPPPENRPSCKSDSRGGQRTDRPARHA